MNLTDSRLKQLDDPTLSHDERAILRCRMAGNLTHAGQYEAAREVLGDLWQGVGERPTLKGLSSLTTAEVLLQVGVLSGWIGSVRQIPDAQEKAEDLLGEALRLFDGQSQSTKGAEVQYELGMCYFRLGAYDTARVILGEALHNTRNDIELKAKTLIRQTLVEVWTGRYHDALCILEQARKFFEGCSDAIKGRWHGQMALVYRRLATAESRTDYADRAIIEFTAAIFHYEQAGHERYCGFNLNNLAMLLYKLGRYPEAHEHLDRALAIFSRLNDTGSIAQANETRAQVLVAEQRYEEANRLISSVVQAFERGGEYALLADALVIQGIIRARLGKHETSMEILRQAITVASNAGADTNAGYAFLALIEEHASRLTRNEIYTFYTRADILLKDTQDLEDIMRLRACAHVMGRRLLGARLSDKGFSLQKVVREYEAQFIEEALELEQGSVSRAAKRLGTKHQILGYLLRSRHKKLMSKRTPPVPRRRSIFKEK